MKTILNIKTDKKVKEQAQKIAKSLGLPLSTVINRYLREFIREQRIEFSEPLIPNARTRKLLGRIEQDIKNGKNIVGPFSSSNEMDTYLNSL